jgi:H+-translocating diphosphatase
MVFGVVVGPVAVAGLLPGALVSGVQLAISMSNTGGAWDNAKKLIESGRFRNKAGEVRKKRSDEHKAAVIGDTVGDPLKNNSFSLFKILFCFLSEVFL